MSVEDLSAEREEALAAARRIVGGNQRSLTGYFEEGDPLTVARALLASASRVEGLERALTQIAEYRFYPDDNPFMRLCRKTASDALAKEK